MLRWQHVYSCVFHSINITLVDRDGDEHTVKAKLGSTLLEVAKEHDVEVEGEYSYSQ